MKATTTWGDKVIIKQIQKLDGVYYGLVKTKGEFIPTALNEKEYEKIQLKNEPVSILVTAAAIVIPFAIVMASWSGPSF